MSNSVQRKRRDRLWAKDPRCRLCGISTVLPKDAAIKHGIKEFNRMMNFLPKDVRLTLATLDHIVSKYRPERRTRQLITADGRTRLLCWGCNDRLSKEETASLSISEKQIRSIH